MADEIPNPNEAPAPEVPAQPIVPVDSSPPSAAPAPVEPSIPTAVASPGVPSGGKKKLSLALIIAGAIVILGGASAGAYFGVIVPNKPENVLKSAAQNLLEQHQVTTKGAINVDLKGDKAPVKNVTINFTSASDTDQKVFDLNLEAAVSGVKLPVEVRGVDKNLYLKVGDLGSVKSVAKLADPAVSSIVDSLSSKLSNQWIEVDQSLLKQVNLECSTDSMSSLSKKDIDDLMKLYGDNEFVSIKNTAKDTVDGKSATRYELGLDKDKAKAFGDKLDSVEGLKKAFDCAKQANDKALDNAGDTEVTPDTSDVATTFNVWVDGSKHVRQIQIKATDKDVEVTITVTLTNDKVDVKKPDGAKPFMEVFGDFGSLFGLGGTGLPGGADDSSFFSSEKCSQQYQAFIDSGGTGTPPDSDCF